MSSTENYQQRRFWETPDLSLLRGYLDKEFCEKVKEKMNKVVQPKKKK